MVRMLGATVAVRDEGALDVRSEDFRAIDAFFHRLFDILKRFVDFGGGSCHCGRSEGGDAVRGVELRHLV